MTLRELREKRAKAVADARAVLDAAEAAGRAMNGEEQRSWDGFMADADTLKATIERRERLEDEERSLEKSNGRRIIDETARKQTSDELRSWLLSGEGDLKLELRAQAIGTDSAGGYLVPEGFSGQVEVALKAFGGIRNAAQIIRTESGNDLPFPMLDGTGTKGRMLGENVAASETDLVFGATTFKAYKFSSDLIRVPVELLQDSGVDLAAIVGAQLGERIGRITNEKYTIGTGTNEPHGIMVAAPVGVTGASTTAVTYDELVDLIHSVDPAYRAGASFMFSDATLKVIRKLKDADNRPLWEPSLKAGVPDMLLGYPVVINQEVAAMAAGAESIAFGDLSKHVIREVRDVTLVRLNERYADQHQVGFLAFYRGDSRYLNAGTGPVKLFSNAAA